MHCTDCTDLPRADVPDTDVVVRAAREDDVLGMDQVKDVKEITRGQGGPRRIKEVNEDQGGSRR